LAQLKADLPSLDIDGIKASLKDIKLPEISADLKAALPTAAVSVRLRDFDFFSSD
jgi:hypothetical protein